MIIYHQTLLLKRIVDVFKLQYSITCLIQWFGIYFQEVVDNNKYFELSEYKAFGHVEATV